MLLWHSLPDVPPRVMVTESTGTQRTLASCLHTLVLNIVGAGMVSQQFLLQAHT